MGISDNKSVVIGWNNICKWREGNWRTDRKGNGESWQRGSNHNLSKSIFSRSFLMTNIVPLVLEEFHNLYKV